MGTEPEPGGAQAASTPAPPKVIYALRYRDQLGDVAHQDGTADTSRPDLDLRTFSAQIAGGTLRVSATYAAPVQAGTSLHIDAGDLEPVIVHAGEREAKRASDVGPKTVGTAMLSRRRLTVSIRVAELERRPRKLSIRTQDPTIYTASDGNDSLWDYAPGGAMTADEAASKFASLRRR